VAKKTLTERVEENSTDILHIKNAIDVISSNHLHHIEKDMAETKASIAKIDNRVWAILVILVSTTIISGAVTMFAG